MESKQPPMYTKQLIPNNARSITSDQKAEGASLVENTMGPYFICMANPHQAWQTFTLESLAP